MDVLNRDELERRLARVLSKGLRAEMSKLLDLLGDPPDLSRVPYEYWQNGWKDIRKDVEPVLVDTFITQAESMMNVVGIGADWAHFNAVAADWARAYTYELVTGMEGTTRSALEKLLQKNIPGYFEEGLTSKELRARLEGQFGAVRADMIAVTETTRAAVEGERAYVAELVKETGRAMIPIWLTANDEIAEQCPICWPKHGKPITDGKFPPAHPRCRCGVAWEWPEEAE
ncbi:MAG: hypothetical protein PHQ10_05230 [Dehalococcoidales bacterium]|nr:hypothetical protein [Dehalococcoidales bacterium]